MEAALTGGPPLALLYLDLDRFKQVNDTCGHAIGDALLQIVATRLTGHTRGLDTAARIGGDEFAILMRLAEDCPAPAALAERLVAELSRPYEIEGLRLDIGVSIGIACCPQDAATAEGLVHCADTALYAAKRGGRNTFRSHGGTRNAA